MDRLQGQGSPILRRKESSNNDNTQQTKCQNMIGRPHGIIFTIIFLFAILLIANNSGTGIQYNSRTNTILFDNSSGNDISSLEKVSSKCNTTTISSVNNNINRIGLDFAVMGFPKCGTTFLLEVLKAHPEVEMGNRTLPSGEIHEEFCQIHHRDGVEQTMAWLQNTKSTATANSRLIKYGIKCPSMIRVMSAVDNLVKMTDHTRLVVGVRHPIKWFESFFNYRVYNHYDENRNETIPKPHELVNGTKHWRDAAVPLGRFDIYLKQLAKTSLNQNELNEMLNHERLWPKNIMPNPYKVFIYTVEQLQDKNKTRQLQFQSDLQHHLGLETSFLDFDEVPKANVRDSTPYKEHINICDSQYADIRNKLLQQGRKSRDWIVNKFIESSDVVVSDKDYFSSVLKEWGVDPCGPSSGAK